MSPRGRRSPASSAAARPVHGNPLGGDDVLDVEVVEDRTKGSLADEGFHAPLDLVDGAARVYDPIVRGEAGEGLHGVFLKDYEPTVW